ncbi:MAG: putative peptidase M15 [Prokaryotic dsDNA virus sp.]|nr:MAG: putative peptidase M15 [Prokaryotic dsDNA virus sp.]
MKLRYFKLKEFDCPTEEGSHKKMNKTLLEKLDYARHNAGVPFVINSAFRNKEYNLSIGGRVGSAHCDGDAVDIKCIGSRDRALILKALLDVGINRIGIAKTFIHADVSKRLDSDVFWLYD